MKLNHGISSQGFPYSGGNLQREPGKEQFCAEFRTRSILNLYVFFPREVLIFQQEHQILPNLFYGLMDIVISATM